MTTMCDPEEFNMYLANLEEFVFDEDKIVSISWLSRTLDIHVALAKKLLSTFTNDESFQSKLSICWFLLGTGKTDPTSRKMLIVPSYQLENAKENFDKITSQHIYSIKKSGKSEPDMNIVYLADQSAEKSIAQCSSLSNIQCDQVKVVANRRNIVATETSNGSSGNKATTSAKPVTKPEDGKKSPVKSTLGNMFSKKNAEIEKKKTDAEKCDNKKSQKVNEEPEKIKKSLADKTEDKTAEDAKKESKSSEKKDHASPMKKSSTGAGKKKGTEKAAGTKNITSFFSKGPLPEIKKAEPVAKKPSAKTNKKDIEEERMSVDEIDENIEPVNVVENVEKEKNQKEKDTKEGNLKSTKKSTKSKNNVKKAEKKEPQKRRRIQVFSDSSESEQEESERARSLSPPPPSPPRVDIKSSLSDDDDDDVIPPTPEPQTNGERKRKRKLVTKTMTDESGFLRTVKEFETVSCSDSDGESNSVKHDAKKPKVQEESKAKNPPAQKSATAAHQKSPAKSKQTSILNFFKKSA